MVEHDDFTLDEVIEVELEHNNVPYCEELLNAITEAQETHDDITNQVTSDQQKDVMKELSSCDDWPPSAGEILVVSTDDKCGWSLVEVDKVNLSIVDVLPLNKEGSEEFWTF